MSYSGIGIALVMLGSVLVNPAASAAEKPPKLTARQALLVTHPLGIVLLSKNAGRTMAPSSMTKIMSALVVIEAIKAGKLRPTDKIEMSKAALRTRGARLKPKQGARLSVKALLDAMIIGSANDASKALAIRVAGSEAAFARRMTARAKALGLANSRFRNATGFNAEGHRMTAQDVAKLAGYLIDKHPRYYALFGRRQVKIGKKTLRNRNPVLGRIKGADGIKTGQTRKGGYGLAASARRGAIRLILVINGLKSAKARRREAARLLEWGFRHLKQ